MALSPPGTFLNVLAIIVVFTVLPVLASAAENGVVVGNLDGTRRITTDDIQNGFDGGKNYMKPCVEYDYHGHNYVLIVEMGSFADHLIPLPGVTLCNLLTNMNATRNYVYAPRDPRDPAWDGYTRVVSEPLDTGVLGGSGEGYTEESGGRTLSFWGDNNDDTSHTGGCCALTPGEPAAWGRPYRLVFVPTKPALYLAWRFKPTVAVVNGPVVFEVNVWNRHSEPYQGNVTFRITANGNTTIAESPTGRYTHYAGPPAEGVREYVIVVEVVNGPETANTKILKAVLNVVGRLPADVSAYPDAIVPRLLHFGEAGTAIRAVERSTALERDWFAPTVVGGEAQIRPQVGSRSMVRIDSEHFLQDVWRELAADDGVFVAKVPHRSLQFYAFSLYSAATQRVTVRYGFDTTAVVYVDGKRFTPRSADPSNESSFDVSLTEGFHQVFIKLFFDQYSVNNRTELLATSKFWMRVVGTAVGYSLRGVPSMEGAAYELMDDLHVSKFLHLGKEWVDFVYGGFDGSVVDVLRVFPQPGRKVGNLTWTTLTSPDGKIPVYGVNLHKGKGSAVSYIAFSLHNGRNSFASVCWTFVTEGETDLFLDSTPAYSRGNGTERKQESVTTYLSPGWHSIILRTVAINGHSWFLSFKIHLGSCEVKGVNALGNDLPPYLTPVQAEAPVLTLMRLVEKESTVGAIPHDLEAEMSPSAPLTDFPLNSRPSSMILSTESVWVLGERRQYEWVAERSTNGLWRGESICGSFNQYRALALYAAEEMKVGIRVASHADHGLWVDGLFVGSSSSSSVGHYLYQVRLARGWNRLILKLNTTGKSRVFHAARGKITWEGAQNTCRKKNGMQLCSLSEICPLGIAPREAASTPQKSFWVPVNSAENGWAHITVKRGNKTLLCHAWRKDDGRWSPAKDHHNRHLGQLAVACCGGTPAPPMWLSVIPPNRARGRVGYTYDFPPAPDRVVVKMPEGVTRSTPIVGDLQGGVPASSTKNDARYRTGGLTFVRESWSLLTRGKATALPNGSSEILVNRVACLAYSPCSLSVKGVEDGWYFSLLRTDTDESMVERFLQGEYAKIQRPSLSFSGVLPVAQKNAVVVPPLNIGSFYMIAYNPNMTGTLAATRLEYRTLSITPKEVVGTQASAFKAEGSALELGDAVLIPTGNPNSPADCGTHKCHQEFSRSSDGVAVIYSNVSFPFTQDLYGYNGSISCLCVCLSCSLPPYTAATVRVESSKVVGFPINITVTLPPAPAEDIVAAIRPRMVRDGVVAQFYGRFDPRKGYAVNFTSSGTPRPDCTKPFCSVLSITEELLTCEVHVNTPLACNWTAVVSSGGKAVPFSSGSFTTLQVHPSPPSVEYVTGSCASISAWCVNDTKLTLHGNNFNPVGAEYNRVIVGDDTSDAVVLCDVLSASASTITCTLKVLQSKGEEIYPIGIETRFSEDEWGERQEAGYLVVGGGAFVGGWTEDPVHRSVWGKNSQVFVVCSFIGVVVIFAIAAIVFSRMHATSSDIDVALVEDDGMGHAGSTETEERTREDTISRFRDGVATPPGERA